MQPLYTQFQKLTNYHRKHFGLVERQFALNSGEVKLGHELICHQSVIAKAKTVNKILQKINAEKKFDKCK